MTLHYGFYSAKSARINGTVFWKDNKGKEWEVTTVSETGKGTAWPDEVTVCSTLVEYSRKGQEGEIDSYKKEYPDYDRL